MIGDKEKSQVDMYDVFGYLMPGFVVFSASILSIGYWHNINVKQIFDLIKGLQPGQFISLSILGLAFSYIAGHVVATISEAIFDRIFVEKIFGYPFETLFHDKSSRERMHSIKKNFYRVLLTLLYVISFLVIFHPLFGANIVGNAIYFLSLALGGIIILKWIENWSEKKKIDEFPSSVHFLLRLSKKTFSLLLLILSAPFQVAETLIRNFLGLDRKFSPELIEEFKKQFEACTGLKYSLALGSDIYWLTYWHVTDRSPYMRDRLYKFLSLYGLTRNSSIALFISAIIVAIPSYYKETGIHSIVLNLSFLSLSFVMSVRYYYLYYNYYSKSLYRSFVVINEEATCPLTKP